MLPRKIQDLINRFATNTKKSCGSKQQQLQPAQIACVHRRRENRVRGSFRNSHDECPADNERMLAVLQSSELRQRACSRSAADGIRNFRDSSHALFTVAAADNCDSAQTPRRPIIACMT
jgi:hypothetical protein